MDAIKTLAELLDSDDTRKRIAAAVVLGELKIKDGPVLTRLVAMAKDPLEPYAAAAVEALGNIGSIKALPVLLDALGRSGEVEKQASAAIAKLGEDALPEIKARLADASTDVRAKLSALLPAVGGKLSFEMALEGMRGQAWDAVNRVALAARQEIKDAKPHDKKVFKTQIEKFLEKKRTQEDENAVRGALKILGYLELAESIDTLAGYLASRQSSLVRTEAATALRYPLAAGAKPKLLKKLIDLLEDKDPLVARAVRDSLTVLKLDDSLVDEFARLVKSPDLEVARWAIARIASLGASAAEKALVPIAGGADRARAEAATAALAQLPTGAALLCAALCRAEEEVGAQVLSEVLRSLARRLGPKELDRLFAAGKKALPSSLSLARRMLEPVREADPERWAELLSEQAKAWRKKDPSKAAALYDLLGRSPIASDDDRYQHALVLLDRSPADLHPKARSRDAALGAFERLAAADFPVAAALLKEKAVSDQTRYYLGFHFVEVQSPKGQQLGEQLLEALIRKNPRNKLGKAAKNKLQLALGE